MHIATVMRCILHKFSTPSIHAAPSPIIQGHGQEQILAMAGHCSTLIMALMQFTAAGGTTDCINSTHR